MSSYPPSHLPPAFPFSFVYKKQGLLSINFAQTIAADLPISYHSGPAQWRQSCSLRCLSSCYMRPPLRLSRQTKSQHWFRSYDSSWFAAAEQQCLNEIHGYQNDIQIDYPGSLCSAALTCLIDNSSESVKMTLASSQVLLGMIPAILSYMGSELLELGVLSTHRPPLVLLMSIGAPALQNLQVFSSLDVASITDRPPSRSVEAYHRWFWGLPKGWQRLVSSGTHAVVAGAEANNIHTSIYLDQRTVVVWRCGTMYLPFLPSLAAAGGRQKLPRARRTRRCRAAPPSPRNRLTRHLIGGSAACCSR